MELHSTADEEPISIADDMTPLREVKRKLEYTTKEMTIESSKPRRRQTCFAP
jgi:hypothetical protein